MFFAIVADLLCYCGNIDLKPDVALKHGWTCRAAFIFHAEGHGAGDRVAELRYLKIRRVKELMALSGNSNFGGVKGKW